MVIQTNEKEFKGKTLQEYLEWKYPAKEDKEWMRKIDIFEINNDREKAGIMERLERGELDLREFINLTKLHCQSSNLTSLDVSGCVKLTELKCYFNDLTSLDVSGCVNLTLLHCSYNDLTSLDVSGCVNLTELHCSYNNLTSLDVSENVDLTLLYCFSNELTSLDVSENVDLTLLACSDNNLTSVDFLNQLPHPEKLLRLELANNNIERTNLEFLRPFVNLEKRLTLGTNEPKRYNNDIYNRFYGSLEPLRNMTKLPGLFINGTDIEEGIEYLPVSISKDRFNCDPKLPNQKVAQIQNELRLFDYDIEAWQLAHPEKMLITRPKYFTNPDSKEKWIKALTDKITQFQQELQKTKTNLPEKVEKIAHLEIEINYLSIIKNLLEELSIERDHSRDIDNWYQRQLGGENAQKRNDLQEQRPKKIQEKGIQTDLNLVKINELKQQDLQNKEELQIQIEQPPK